MLLCKEIKKHEIKKRAAMAHTVTYFQLFANLPLYFSVAYFRNGFV